MKKEWTLKSNEEICCIKKRAEKQFPSITMSEDLERASNFFKSLADETRLKVISLLWLEDLCMCEIVEALNSASSTISHHLRIMEKGGVIQSRKVGKFTIYRLKKEKLENIIPFINQNIDGDGADC